MPAKIFGDMSLDPGPSENDPSSPIHPLSPTIMDQQFPPTPSAPCTEDIVISGMSGRLPECDNMAEFSEKLMQGVDMVTDDGRRWTPGLHGLPKRGGKLKDISKFDASFFGVHGKQANAMDPQLRIILETTYEAIVDAGVDPVSIRGSKTGVFIGCSASESHDAWTNDMESTVGYEMTGCTRSMFANRLSFFFDFKGPSYAIDTACSSSLLALHQALQAIKTGECEAAIVGGCNLCLKPATTLQFQKLNMLSPDGACKSFDASGNGYVRSEAVVSVYLQKQSNANRIYATLVHSKTNTDGNKTQGITFPSGEVQKNLLLDVYKECGVDPAEIAYIEAHGTGTKVGDPQEVNTIVDVFCKKGRPGPLLIGSTKSNMGHPEPASGLAALAKVLISMEAGFIAPNLHYNKPNTDIPGLSDGRLSVVTTPTKWTGGYAALNSFGFGGANVHVLIKSNSIQASEPPHPASNVQRLVTYSGRTQSGLLATLEELNTVHAHSVELQALLQKSANSTPQTHPYRGFTIANNGNKITDVQKITNAAGPVWFVFAGMGTQWHGMGRDLMSLHTFEASIRKSARSLEPHGINLYALIMDGDEQVFEEIINSFVGIAAIQVALVDVLQTLGIRPDGIVGHSVGELGCAYADGGLTAEETVLAAYWRGHCVKEAQLPPGGMAAVGLTWAQAKERCPEGVVPACHNSIDTVTISGPVDAVKAFVEQLKSEGIFAKEVNSGGVAFHSYYMAKTAPALKKALKHVIREPRRRSERWVSSSIPAVEWDSDLAQLSSAEYHVNNLLSPVLFQEALQHIPAGAVTIEVAPHCLLQAILKRSLSPTGTFVGLMKRGHRDNMEFFLTSLGKLYEAGLNFDPLSLFASVRLPVPAGTPLLAPLLRWDHGATWSVPTMDQLGGGAAGSGGGGASRVYEIELGQESPDDYIVGHKIDGRVLYPATGYMVLAWRAFAKLSGQVWTEMKVAFEDVSIHRATIMPNQGKVKFEVSVSPGNGNFEVCTSGGLVASGRIYQPDSGAGTSSVTSDASISVAETSELNVRLTSRDVYKELRLRGYDYGPTFQGIVSAHNEGTDGHLLWNNNWVSFLDTMMQIQILTSPGSTLRLPTRIKYLVVDPTEHLKNILEVDANTKAVKAHVDTELGTCMAGGVEMLGLHTTVAPRRPNQQAAPILERYTFVPYNESEICLNDDKLKQYHSACEKLVEKALESGLKQCFDQYKTQILSELENNTNVVNMNVDEKFNCTLMKLLQHVSQLESETDVKEVMMPHEKDLSEDTLMGTLLQERSLKACLDVALENCTSSKFKIAELGAQRSCIYKHILPMMATQPQLQLQYSAAISNKDAQLDEDKLNEFGVSKVIWDVKDAPPNTLSSSDLVLMNDTLSRQPCIRDALSNIKNIMKDGSFLLIKEYTSHFSIPLLLHSVSSGEVDITDQAERTCGPFCDISQWREILASAGFQVVSVKGDGLMSSLILCKFVATPIEEPVIIHCDSLGYEWVEEIKQALYGAQETGDSKRVWLVSSSLNSGLVGMVNCLRKEPGGQRIRCLVGDQCVSNVLQKDIVMNVFKNGQYGSFRHISIPAGAPKIKTTDAYVNILNRGDLSSLAWVESPMKHFQAAAHPEESLCRVCYTSLNFRDVMLATGKLPPDAIPGDLASQDCILGMEFSGKEEASDRRVMGLLAAKGLATTVSANKRFLWEVPTSWSLEEAASVPVVYATAYYALVIRGRVRAGESVLIHSGSGGVGQAAISIALHTGCKVFTTVGSQAKREYLKKRFPQLTDSSFANSRDTTFERHILKNTKGRGVDVVLNSLADDKLQASLRVLAQHGRFLEIGKVDLSNNTPLGMAIFLRNITFHGILLDALFDPGNKDWDEVADLVRSGIADGAVQPLQTSMFERDHVEEAFRFMAQGRHIGKVVIKVRDEGIQQPIALEAFARTSCHPDHSYIITGGLGGFGLELAQWLIDRGAQKIVLTSRSGVKTGYQARKIRVWETAGVTVIVSCRDITSLADTEELLKETMTQLGPVGGIFHLAMVLQDAFFEGQSPKTFAKVGDAKVAGTEHLNVASRHLCPLLQFFVVFSSVSCGRGNAGQSSYGYANSYMERVCEQRQQDGLPGLAVQWGAIGDVGVVQDTMGDNSTVVGGTLPQRITSCLATMDAFLNMSDSVLSSFVLAEKAVKKMDGASEKSLADAVAHILGIKDASSINPSVTLGDLGLDSLMGVEVKLTLERDFDLILPIQEIRALTFSHLEKIASGNKCETSGEVSDKTVTVEKQPLPVTAYERYDVDEMVPQQTLIPLREGDGNPIFLIHPIEGSVKALKSVAQHLKGPVYGLQCSEDVPLTSINDLAQHYIKMIQTVQAVGPYNIAGYSFGACVAFEMVLQMQEANGADVHLSLLDGSHNYVAAHTQDRKKSAAEDESTALSAYILQFCSLDFKQTYTQLLDRKDMVSRLDLTADILMSTKQFSSAEAVRKSANIFYKLLIIADSYKPSSKLEGNNVCLIKAKKATHEAAKLGEDYGLKDVVNGDLKSFEISGDHTSFIQRENAQKVAFLLDREFETWCQRR